MSAHPPIPSVPDPTPPQEEGSLVTFLALLDAECERDPNAMYEPWSPRQGDRVVCQPSPECCVTWGDGVPNGHPIEETGAIGTVAAMPDHFRFEAWITSHPYAVRFDPPGIQVNGEGWWGGMFAAVELVPIDDCERDDAHPLAECSRRGEP